MLYEITRAVARHGASGTTTTVVAYIGERIHDQTTARLGASELAAAEKRTADGRAVTYGVRRVYLPACSEHEDEHDGRCGNCEDVVESWMAEIAESARERQAISGALAAAQVAAMPRRAAHWSGPIVAGD